MSCHTTTDRHTMHQNPGVILGCTDCHGGNASIEARGEKREAKEYVALMRQAHVLPRDEKAWNWPSSATPERTYTLLNKESAEFIRFMNPGDLRVARESCGACHLPIIHATERSLMATSAMFWGGATYNNGILPYKRYIVGEAYTHDGLPASIVNPVKVDPFLASRGILPSLTALPAWETIPPSDVFRVFERGGRIASTQFPEIGLPNSTGALQKLDEPGRPDIRQSNRGPGTGSRIAVPAINITKTRLNDPHLWFLGTEDQPGDYRSSGCSACHVVYANDLDPAHSGPYARFGHDGGTATSDPTIKRDEPGHPIRHAFTRAIPSSQCMVCHMHQPNVFVNSFYGTIMWDYESDAAAMWPKQQKYPTAEEARKILDRNPEEAAIRGNWGDPEFSRNVSSLNPQLNDTQFADYHGHGWNFRSVFKRDRHGALLDKDGKEVSDADRQKFGKAVHLTSIHLDLGFHCVDCHFSQDAHGNGHIYGEVPAAVEIDCADCHGTATQYPTLRTTGPASRPGGLDMSLLRTQDGRRRFEWRQGKLFQRSALNPDLEWEMTLVKDTVTPGNAKYNEKAARAKLMLAGADGRAGKWGSGAAEYAHGNDKMTCFSCHLSWTTSCAGCHLPIQANWKTGRNHYEGGETRNYATYNPQVARDDMFQLGVAGPVKGSRIEPIRSSSALVLSSTNINRERIYVQQPPVSASGFSSQAFAPHYPHTERKTETKQCSDCHVSAANDNNAIMAQLLLQGTNFVNFVGFHAWLGEEKSVEAVQVTEWDEPQAVIGSYLHRHAYPDFFAAHRKRDERLENAYGHSSGGAVGCIALRGEYLYAAEGAGGLRVYDVANIGNKGVSQKIVTAPFSPLGHDTHIASRDATCVALPTNQSINPLRNAGDLMRVTNQEQAFHPIYHYAVMVDSAEGLILVNVDTLADGEPRNNFLARALTWNPGGVLDGATHVTLGGHYAYVAARSGLVIVDLDDPLKPIVVAQVPLDGVRGSALQFRYLFVTDAAGLEVIDVTVPEKARIVPGARVALADARRVYVARTYAYVAAGREGLAIIDVERPTQPKLFAKYDAEGKISDARDVIVGSTNASLFAYVADGVKGLKVVQLTAPDTQPRFYGFSPEPRPQLIAWRETSSPATALAKGLDRDRAVDETGGQIAVFGRIGSRPFTRDEMRRMYQNPDGSVWTVKD
jgi:LVIVD repeat